MAKAIETFYNGYRFRSRLEARWALFFDEAKIEYQYEKEGFDLSNRQRYLPDFYLPKFNYWVEVKDSACDEDVFHKDMQKIKCMIMDGLADNFIILSDIPKATKEKNVFWFPSIHRSMKYCAKYICERVTFLSVYEDEDGAYIQDDYYEGCNQKTYNIFMKYGKPEDIRPTFIESNREDRENITVNDSFAEENILVANAYQKARYARFEYGEHGNWKNQEFKNLKPWREG